MAPFLHPNAVIQSFKEKVDAITVQGDRLYLGTSTGNLHIYNLNNAPDQDDGFTLVELKKGLTRRTIEQLGFIKDINSLVVLSEATITLFPLPMFSPPTPLVKAKAAFSFAIHSSIQHIPLDTKPEYSLSTESVKPKLIPSLVTQLLVGCRRKVVLYSWKDGEAQDVKECTLPHSARVISFLNDETACFAYSPTDYAIFSITTMSAIEVSTPLPTTTSATAMGALTGLTGYMTLGLGAKAKPAMVRISESEVLIAKDNEGNFIGVDGKSSRTDTIEWPAAPEELAFIKPYIFSVLPAGSVPSPTVETSSPNPSVVVPSQPPTIPTTVVQIRSSLSLHATQIIPFPFTPSTSNPTLPTVPANATIRLMTSSPSEKSPLFLISTPTDKVAAAAEGSTVWQFCMKPWAEQIDELVQVGQYADALDLLNTIEEAVLPDKETRRTRIRVLNALSEYCDSKFDSAIDTFIELDFNPAKVVALYPESVAGRLSVPQERWVLLYGGPDNGSPQQVVNADESHRSIETLVRYLSDRRPKLKAALEAVRITPQGQSHEIAPLSETSTEELFALPNAPLSALTPEQLLRCAQIVDTALYKSYLIIRPGLLGPLCRIANWCEVSEVEEDLRARQKFAELRDLYHGKKMHAQALSLLKQLSEHEEDMEEKLLPSISYLQKLGPEHLQQIFASSRWIFETDQDMAFEIFTSEDVELPRQEVADYLEGIDPKICARYLEYIVDDRHEESIVFHDRLAELYLSIILSTRKQGNGDELWKGTYSKLLRFIDCDQHYTVDRLYGLLSSTDLFEGRAILLGRLGRHDQALELYVYRMHDYSKAEEYCKRVYKSGTETDGVFLTLLRIYLRPTVDSAADLLTPALDLISRHNPRLDAIETLQLLPPLVTGQDVRGFLIEALRAPVFDTAVIRQINKSRNDQLARKLMVLQSKRVKVTDSRICPQCHKRIGNSVIAVHTPRGEVTHYQCRENFSRQLNEAKYRA